MKIIFLFLLNFGLSFLWHFCYDKLDYEDTPPLRQPQIEDVGDEYRKKEYITKKICPAFYYINARADILSLQSDIDSANAVGSLLFSQAATIFLLSCCFNPIIHSDLYSLLISVAIGVFNHILAKIIYKHSQLKLPKATWMQNKPSRNVPDDYYKLSLENSNNNDFLNQDSRNFRMYSDSIIIRYGVRKVFVVFAIVLFILARSILLEGGLFD